MKVEIEKIVASDEATQKNVAAARFEAQNMRVQAQRTAEEIIAQKEKEIERLEREALEKITLEAQSKARRVLEETDRYLERLRQQKKEQSEALVNDLLKRLIGF